MFRNLVASTIVLDDWTAPYPESVKQHIKSADACIWSVKVYEAFMYVYVLTLRLPNRSLAITPTKSKGMDFAEVTRVNSDYTLNGLSQMAAMTNKPFRFVYVSGVTIERDQSKSLPFLAEYRLMRVRLSFILFISIYRRKSLTKVGPRRERYLGLCRTACS